MSGNRDKRLAKLERKRRPLRIVFVRQDREAGWTVEEAIARAYPEGPPPGVEIRILAWMTEDDMKAYQDRMSLGQADP